MAIRAINVAWAIYSKIFSFKVLVVSSYANNLICD